MTTGRTAAPLAEIGEITLMVPTARARYSAAMPASWHTPAMSAGATSGPEGISMRAQTHHDGDRGEAA